METPPDLKALELALKELLSTIPNDDTELSWNRVADIARELANGLRIRDGPDYHSILGESLLPQSLSALLGLSLHGSPTPKAKYANATHELLRAAANFCMDHDDNRANLLDAGFPQAVVSLLEGYSDPILLPPSRSPLPLNISDLKIIRTSIGVLLNASLGFDPVQFRLISLELPFTILKLSSAIYPAGYWVNPVPTGGSETDETSWIVRRDISNWSWRIINELKDLKGETLRIFDAKVLPLLTPPLLQFCEPHPTKHDPLFGPGSLLFSTLLHTDFEILEESCTLIEALALDMEDVRLALARGLYNPAEHGGVPCLSAILDFIEFGAYPMLWKDSAFGDLERKRKEKGFDMCKAALIKSVVEVAGDDRNQDIILENSDAEKPGGRFVYKMVKWINDYVKDTTSRSVEGKVVIDRDDLVICATLSLGNLAKKEKICTTLLTPPYALAPSLISAHFLSPMADINVKHGIIGLLKHLAQSSTLSSVIRTSLYEAQVIQRISESGIWDEKSDAMADIVQVNAINVVKHLCNANIDFTLVTMALSNSDKTNCKSAMYQILALVSRSDNVTIKSEGTRVLVNVVKSLWSYSPFKVSAGDKIVHAQPDTEKQLKKEMSISQLFTPECAFALASLVGRSGRYPILVNEGIVAMSLLSTRKEAGPVVLESLTKLLPNTPAVEPIQTSSTNEPVSPAGKGSSRLHLPKPRHALDMIVFVLRNVDNPVNFPVEIRVNACMFLVSLTKNVSGEQLSPIKELVCPVLERILESQLTAEDKEEMLVKSARKLLDTWS